jgi:hypothetical protein
MFRPWTTLSKTLDRAWTKWAAEQGVSEAIAAALYLLSENRKAERSRPK